MKLSVVLKDKNDRRFVSSNVISFHFTKDVYTPYTSLSVRFTIPLPWDVFGISQVWFYINDRAVHHGLADKTQITQSAGKNEVSLYSRGFTSLLSQNQLPPGMIQNVSVDDIITGYYTLPYVTHEANNDKSNYIYVKNGSSLWDGVVNLTYKLNGTYPYIRDMNCVRITPESEPLTFSYNESDIIAVTDGQYTQRMVSHVNMADISDNYDTYFATDDDAADFNIVRHRVKELDKQFLYDPQQAVEFAGKFAKRAMLRHGCIYSGCNCEELNDIIKLGTAFSGRIGRVEVNGGSQGVFTEVSAYDDGFYNYKLIL